MIRTGRSGVLTQDESLQYSIKYDGVIYGPTDSAVALGTLLFGMKPFGLEFHAKFNPAEFIEAMKEAGLELHAFANGSNTLPNGTVRFSDAKLMAWLKAAKHLAPDDTAGKDVVKAVFTNMGPYAPDSRFFDLVVTAPADEYAPDAPRVLKGDEANWMLERLGRPLEKDGIEAGSNVTRPNGGRETS